MAFLGLWRARSGCLPPTRYFASCKSTVDSVSDSPDSFKTTAPIPPSPQGDFLLNSAVPQSHPVDLAKHRLSTPTTKNKNIPDDDHSTTGCNAYNAKLRICSLGLDFKNLAGAFIRKSATRRKKTTGGSRKKEAFRLD